MPSLAMLARAALLAAGLAYSPAHAASETVVYSFQSSSEGTAPFSALTAVDGALYGAANLGGLTGCGETGQGCGTIFRVTPAGEETTLHVFNGGNDGAFPTYPPAAKNHRLDGTTGSGGGKSASCMQGCGVAYTMTESGALKITHRFGTAGDGTLPGPLTEFGRTVYGTTFRGGAAGLGTIFAIGPAGYRTVFTFRGRGTHGFYPEDNLVPLNGKFYGTTVGAAKTTYGSIFSVTKNGAEKTIYTFKGGADGLFPNGMVLLNGAF